MPIVKKNNFAQQSLERIFSEKRDILDIGGGARIDATRNNRKNENENLLKKFPEVNYRILDKVPDFKPDYVGDVHALIFPNETWDAVLCISVLEHVEKPIQAVQEIHRILKPGGYAFFYVPFLFYYHAEEGYYQDFYRFTHDGVAYLTRDFSSVDIRNARGPLGTVANLVPIFSKHTGLFDLLDTWTGKNSTRQTSGYSAFCIK